MRFTRAKRVIYRLGRRVRGVQASAEQGNPDSQKGKDRPVDRERARCRVDARKCAGDETDDRRNESSAAAAERRRRQNGGHHEKEGRRLQIEKTKKSRGGRRSERGQDGGADA